MYLSTLTGAHRTQGSVPLTASWTLLPPVDRQAKFFAFFGVSAGHGALDPFASAASTNLQPGLAHGEVHLQLLALTHVGNFHELGVATGVGMTVNSTLAAFLANLEGAQRMS